ncbi:MAG: tetratricopeptide repeat protein [Roseiarcus sp.]|jgi:TPR repeat protein
MWIRRLFFVALTVALGLAWAEWEKGGSVGDGAAGDYAPANIERTYGRLTMICVIPIPGLCPVSSETRNTMKRAMAGSPAAEYLLALDLRTGGGVPEDDAAGLAWEVRAAEHGNPRAAIDLEAELRNGEAIEVDETKIVSALKPEVEADDVDAMRALGAMTIRGRGVKQDPAQGLDLLKRAVAKGSRPAEADLAELYLLGAPGVPANRGESMRWLTISASQGDVESMTSLGSMWMNTPGDVPSSAEDLTQSYCWLMRAALLDWPPAQEQLAMNLSRGQSDDHGAKIPVDLVQADAWFRLGARNPFHNNPSVRASIEPKMTTDEMNEAKRQVDAWRPRTFEDVKTLTIAFPPATRGGASPRNCPAMG